MNPLPSPTIHWEGHIKYLHSHTLPRLFNMELITISGHITRASWPHAALLHALCKPFRRCFLCSPSSSNIHGTLNFLSFSNCVHSLIIHSWSRRAPSSSFCI